MNACDDLKALASAKAADEGSTGSSVIKAYIGAAETMLEEDVKANRRQGK